MMLVVQHHARVSIHPQPHTSESSSCDDSSEVVGSLSSSCLRKRGGATSAKMLIWIRTVSRSHTHGRAAKPMGNQAFVAKLHDSAQLYPQLKPEW